MTTLCFNKKTGSYNTARLAALLVVTLGAILFMPLTAGHSEAQSRICLRLERQLVALSGKRRSANPLRVLKYNTAIKRQKDRIRQTSRQIRRASCSRASNKRSSGCRRLTGGLRKMEINLRKLRAERSRVSGKRPSTSRERRRIKRALSANGCNRLRSVKASNRSGVIFKRPERRRTIIEQVFGNDRDYQEPRRRKRPYYDEEKDFTSDEPIPGTGAGTFRTLCVRTCDGYYFPISYSTNKDNFERDVQACTAKCPGTATKLYYHLARGESSENMVSVDTQEPYTILDKALKNRTKAARNCGCDFTKGQQASIVEFGDANGALPKLYEPIVGTPVFRVDRGEDPETLSNLKGNFIPLPAGIKSGIATNKSRKKRKVRIVGEAFFPSQ